MEGKILWRRVCGELETAEIVDASNRSWCDVESVKRKTKREKTCLPRKETKTPTIYNFRSSASFCDTRLNSLAGPESRLKRTPFMPAFCSWHTSSSNFNTSLPAMDVVEWIPESTSVVISSPGSGAVQVHCNLCCSVWTKAIFDTVRTCLISAIISSSCRRLLLSMRKRRRPREDVAVAWGSSLDCIECSTIDWTSAIHGREITPCGCCCCCLLVNEFNWFNVGSFLEWKRFATLLRLRVIPEPWKDESCFFEDCEKESDSDSFASIADVCVPGTPRRLRKVE